MSRLSFIISILLIAKSITCFAESTNAVDLELGDKLYQQKCASCHGAEGNPMVATFPKLAGQNINYLRKELQDYQKSRNNPIMTPIALALNQEDMANLIAYIHTFKPVYGAANSVLKASGEKIYRVGNAEKNIPACSACHSPEGLGNNEAKFPVIAGQNTEYIIQQLQAFASGTRTNDPNGMMRDIALRLSPQDMQAVASFMDGLQPSER